MCSAGCGGASVCRPCPKRVWQLVQIEDSGKLTAASLKFFAFLKKISTKLFHCASIMVSPPRGSAGEERCPAGGCASLARRFTPGYLWCRPTGLRERGCECCCFVLAVDAEADNRVRGKVRDAVGQGESARCVVRCCLCRLVLRVLALEPFLRVRPLVH